MSPCNTCGKSVKGGNSVKCNICLKKKNLKCKYLNYVDFQYIKLSNKTGHCYNCSKDLFPFTTINYFVLYSLLSSRFYCNRISCNYYDIDQLQTWGELTYKSSYSLFHLDNCSLSKIIDAFEHLIQSTKTDLDIIAVSESSITKNKFLQFEISIPNYSYNFCATKANTGGIRNHLSNKTWNDLKIYKSSELESKLIEICYPKKTNIIMGCIYKHPNMDINEYKYDYLNELLDKISKENGDILFLMILTSICKTMIFILPLMSS